MRKTLCFALGTLGLAPLPIFAASFSGPLQDGQIYALETQTEGGPRWLEARTDRGGTREDLLHLRDDAQYTGVLWKVHAQGNGIYTFESLGTSIGPRWLGVNAAGLPLILASDAAGSTRWRVRAVEGGRFTLENTALSSKRFLDGKPEIGDVALASETGGSATGTAWTFHSQTATGRPLHHGEVISLKSQHPIEGPRWLDGFTHNGELGLQWSETRPQFSGSSWRVHENGDGSYSLESLGAVAGSRWLAVRDGKAALTGSTDRGAQTRWEILGDAQQGVTLRNVDGGSYLYGSSLNAQVSLTGEAGPNSLGARWTFVRQSSAKPDREGRWSAVGSLPTVSIHAALMPTGKVLLWSRYIEDADMGGSSEATPRGQSNTFLFDPQTGESQTVPAAPVDAFCSNHAFLPDGRLLVNGGHVANFRGQKSTQIFDPKTNTWSYSSDWNMNDGRWYPATVTLPNGDIFTMSGTKQHEGDLNRTPQVFSLANYRWRELPGLKDCDGPCSILYPWLHLAPNGKIFASGASDITGYIDPNGSGSFTPLARTNAGFRGAYMGTSVQYQPGKILITGGVPATSSTEIIDLNAASPQWKKVGNMAVKRREPTSTLLADGSVLLSGGNEDSGIADATSAFSSEIWSPVTEQFAAADHTRIPRLYHSASLLLPDGRVLNMGGGFGGGFVPHKNYQIYSPPYLFQGDRPQIGTAPAELDYGQNFKVAATQAAAITKVHLIRLGSTTHAFNGSQTLVPLTYKIVDSALEIVAPTNRNIAPPGPYMLFVVNARGIPSTAAIVTLN